MKKRKLWISIAGILVIVVISVTQVTKFKFLFEVLRISSSLSTVSSDFYSEPIEDITYKNIIYKKRGNTELKLDIYSNEEAVAPSPVIIYVFGNGWMYGDKVIPSAIESIINS